MQLGAVSLGTVALNSCIFLFSFLLFLTVPEIAAAVVKKDDEQVSRVAAQSMWLAMVFGVVTGTLVFFNAGAIVAALNPPEPRVAAFATEYIRIRALACPCTLLGFVTTGVFRGFKDTRTPLLGTAASVGFSFCLHVLLLNVLHMEVAGAAIAAACASLASCGVMVTALIKGGKLRPHHLASPPSLAAVLPLMQRGVVLGGKNLVAFGMILIASTVCVRMGSAFQASFEVIRQLWSITMPFFECINVATQALCAAALGKEDVATARSLLFRLLSLGVGIGAVGGVLVWGLHVPLISFFTNDPVVISHVLTSLPLICIFFPIDAAGSIFDGSLLAAKQSNYLSAVQVFGSAVQYVALMWVISNGHASALAIWGAIKFMSVARVVGGVSRTFLSRKSAYRLPAPSEAAAAAAAPAGASGTAAAAGEEAAGVTAAAAAAEAEAPDVAVVETPSLTVLAAGAGPMEVTIVDVVEGAAAQRPAKPVAAGSAV
ncbi:hypothetical protein HYH03_001987 [Edaphochlamys debaryana]|uniref:Protein DETOXIFICATION n=1 Tax=Edaphochlamys debaryana TaxID=47281 RepID=A0A835YCZ0_9CHLO|nr:hypothetical protein HYH03_001987 [Edaphochlamys debaryana]|eukprot:KAG2500418.1 hypothetical protein HYH03_001987 [Edaphochlamys debaryana]